MKVGYFIDWLECYCIESKRHPIVDVLKERNYKVEILPYTTRIYKEVLSVSDSFGVPVATITHLPLSVKCEGSDGILKPGSCHIKLSNNRCYQENVGGFMLSFLKDCHVTLQSISRVDICADFQYFQNGLRPDHLIGGFAREKYLKIGQPRFTLHGTTDRGYNVYNSVLFGSKNSNIYTRFYCKSLEMKEVKQKNWIVDCWKALEFDLSRDVWRVEFAISAPGRKRVVEYFEKDASGKRIYAPEVREIQVSDLCSRDKIAAYFMDLAAKYFVFTKNDKNVRKYDQERLILFPTYDGMERWKPLPTCHSGVTTRTDRLVYSYLVNATKDASLFTLDERVEMKSVARTIRAHKRLRDWANWKFSGADTELLAGIPVEKTQCSTDDTAVEQQNNGTLILETI